jgi:membrane-bound ClpP family serine protease
MNTMGERQTFSGSVGGWAFIMRGIPTASLSIGRKYLEIRLPFHEPKRFSPGLVRAIVKCNIPFIWYSVDIIHESKNFPNPIDFHLWWPFSAKSLEKALIKYGYIQKYKTEILKEAEWSEYNKQVNKSAKVINPLLPYGVIDIEGKAFSAMSLSGNIIAGEVTVKKIGNTALLVESKNMERFSTKELVGKIGTVVKPLMPYGEIDIRGKTFEAMSISGDIAFGKVIVYSQGRYVLLVKNYSLF